MHLSKDRTGRRRRALSVAIPLLVSAVLAGCGDLQTAAIEQQQESAADVKPKPADESALARGVAAAASPNGEEPVPELTNHALLEDGVASETAAPDPVELDATAPSITLSEPANDVSLAYDLVLLRGTAKPTSLTSIELRLGGRTQTFPVVNGRWKAFALMKQGLNNITLAAGGVTKAVKITYKPPANRRFIRFIYVLGSDGDGSFEAPAGEPHDKASALARIGTAARVMQVLSAEMSARQGFGRRTFRIDRNAAGEPLVTTFRSVKSTAQLRAMTGGEIWSQLYDEFATLPKRTDSIDVAILAMTKYDPSTGTAAAHTALGGGRLGVFGSAGLHTWAASVDQIMSRFSDTRRIDTTKLFDDSVGRNTHWANYATTLGATLHELGHCFSLPHPKSGIGIMARGFDNVNRVLLLNEPPSANTAGLSPIAVADESVWDRSAAVRLRYHRFFGSPDPTYAVNTPPPVKVASGTLTITSRAGLRHVGYMVNGLGASHEEFLTATPPASFSRTLAQLRTQFPDATSAYIDAIDNDGNIGGADVTW